MSTTIEAFLEIQLQNLKSINDRTSLSEWHKKYALDWCSNAKGLADNANEVFDLSGEQKVQPDLAYLAVETENNDLRKERKPVILLSLNPSYDTLTSPNFLKVMGQDIENNTVDAEQYDEFRRAFFPRWMNEVVKPAKPRGGSWWNKALSFVHLVAGSTKPKGMAKVDDSVDVIGWEISPLRSNKDGITKAMKTHSILKDFAKESINAALRVDSQCVVIASRAGYSLLEELSETMNVELVQSGEIDEIRVASYVAENGRKLFAINRQLFAGWGTPSNETREALINWISGDLQPDAIDADPKDTEAAPQQEIKEEKEEAKKETTSKPKVVPISHTSPTRIFNISDEISDSKSLVWLRPITKNRELELSEFSGDEDVHKRLGGYWVLSEKRATIINNALLNNQKVYVAGVSDRRVLRVLEITTTPELPIQEIEHSGPRVYKREAEQDTLLQVHGGSWATNFKETTGQLGTPERIRLHTKECDDENWVGCKIAFPTNANPKIYSINE